MKTGPEYRKREGLSRPSAEETGTNTVCGDGRGLPSSKAVSGRQRPWGEWLGYGINGVLIWLALSFFRCRTGQNLFMGPLVPIIFGLLAVGLLVGLPLSCKSLFRGRKVDGIVGVILSLTSLPVFTLLFMLIARAKHFTFY